MSASLLRPYIGAFGRKMTGRDKRRVKKNKAIRKYQMVKKPVDKTGRLRVFLGPVLWGVCVNIHACTPPCVDTIYIDDVPGIPHVMRLHACMHACTCSGYVITPLMVGQGQKQQ